MSLSLFVCSSTLKKSSEYEYGTAREIIISGIRGWKRRVQRRVHKEQPIYRPGCTTVKAREHKKLMARETWYREQPAEDDEYINTIEGSKIQETWGEKATKNGPNKKRGGKGPPTKKSEAKIKSVMFVPYTPGSQLAKMLRENEEKLAKVTKNRMKIVERTGTQLQHVLTKANPWKGEDCERTNCLLCNTKLLTKTATNGT